MGEVIQLASWEFRPILQVVHGGCGGRRMLKGTQGRGVELGPESYGTGAPVCAGKAGKEALPTWRVLGPWQQVEGGLALPDIGLAEAGLGLERRVWFGAGVVVAKEPLVDVAGLVHRTLPGGR